MSISIKTGFPDDSRDDAAAGSAHSGMEEGGELLLSPGPSREQNVLAPEWEGPISGRVIYTARGEAAACLATRIDRSMRTQKGGWRENLSPVPHQGTGQRQEAPVKSYKIIFEKRLKYKKKTGSKRFFFTIKEGAASRQCCGYITLEAAAHT